MWGMGGGEKGYVGVFSTKLGARGGGWRVKRWKGEEEGGGRREGEGTRPLTLSPCAVTVWRLHTLLPRACLSGRLAEVPT